MRTAVRWLFDVKAPFARTSPTQLKVGRINFYPDKGTIYLGGRAPLPQRGLREFQELLRTREGLGAAGIIRDPKPRQDRFTANGRDVSDASLGGRRWRGKRGTTGHQERFWWQAGLLKLFRHAPQG